MFSFYFQLLYAFLAVIILGLVSYTDLKARIAPNYLTYSLIGAGLFFHLIESLFVWSFLPLALCLSGAVLAFFFSLVLYKLGAWAGGDVKLFTGLGALIPVYLVGPASLPSLYHSWPVFPFLVLINSVLLAFPFVFLYVFWRTYHRPGLREDFKQMLRKTLVRGLVVAASVYGLEALLAFFQLSSWLSLPLLILVFALPSPGDYLVAGGLLVWGTVMGGSATLFFSVFLFAFLASGFLEAVSHGRKALRREVPVRELGEGMIPAETVYVEEGKPKKMSRSWMDFLRLYQPEGTVVSDLEAGGITSRQIKQLKNLGVKSLMVKESVPMIPILLLGCIASLTVGDLAWMIVSALS